MDAFSKITYGANGFGSGIQVSVIFGSDREDGVGLCQGKGERN